MSCAFKTWFKRQLHHLPHLYGWSESHMSASPPLLISRQKLRLRKSFQVVSATRMHLDALPSIEKAVIEHAFPDLLPGQKFDRCVPHSVLGIAQRDGRLWVATVSGQAAGFALVERRGDFALLSELGVVPPQRHRGLGSALVARAVRWACLNRFQSLGLTVASLGRSQVPFYARLGFRQLEDSGCCPVLDHELACQASAGMRGVVAMRLHLCHGPEVAPTGNVAAVSVACLQDG